MTNRERFHAVMGFEKPDRPCQIEHGFWPDTHDRWLNEGLPQYVIKPDIWNIQRQPNLYDYFDVTQIIYTRAHIGYVPAFEEKILEDHTDYRVVITGLGVKQKVRSTFGSPPQFLESPVKTRKDYSELRDRMTGSISDRYPKDLDERGNYFRSQNEKLAATFMPGFFGWSRSVMGLTGFLIALHEEPELIKDIIKDQVTVYKQVYPKIIEKIAPDFAFIWEDMCYSNGPLLSPEHFREFMLPAYREICGFLREMGVRNIVVDTDGDVKKLIPLFLEGGVNGLLPFEVKAGMDVVAIGEQFPELRIFGGINKHEIALGRKAIDTELSRVLPTMMRRGGYFVTMDHHVPPDVSMDDFQYYLDQARRL